MNCDVRIMTPNGQHVIHWSDLPEDTSGGPLSTEWNTYRREVGRLLAEGHEGEWVLIKGETIIGLWPTESEAYAVALDRFLLQPVFLHQVLTHEPILRGPARYFRCRV